MSAASINQRNLNNVHVNSTQDKGPSCLLRLGQILSVMGIIAALFLILAAHQVLPHGVNAISSIGVGGYVLSWGLMGVAITLLAALIVKSFFSKSEAPLKTNGYRNEESILLTPLSDYKEAELFVTEDSYCFVIEEYKQMLKNQFCFYNPYTQVKLSDADVHRLKAIPAIKQCCDDLQREQQENASKISDETIKALISLAEGFLNRDEILQMSHKPVPVAQGYLDRFACYYGNLNEEERKALDSFWVPQSHIEETKNIRFGDLYSTMDQNCVHSNAEQIVLMVWQLKANAVFHVEGFFASATIRMLREEHDKNTPFV